MVPGLRRRRWCARVEDVLWDILVAPYKEVAWFTEPLSMVVRTSLSGFLLICLPTARRMRLVISFGIALLYALIVANGEPFQSPAVNTVAYTAWFFVTSTFFMALCVTQSLAAPQLRVVSAVLAVVGQILVVGLAVLRHVAEAPVRDLCRRIRGGGPFEKYEFEKLYAAGGELARGGRLRRGPGVRRRRLRRRRRRLGPVPRRVLRAGDVLEGARGARHEKEKIEGWLKLLAEAAASASRRRAGPGCGAAKRRADELEAAIDRDLKVSDAVAALAEVNNEPGDPQPRQQLLLRSDGGTVTDAALAAVRSCTGATDLLVKSKLGLDETVLPPMLRVLAALFCRR